MERAPYAYPPKILVMTWLDGAEAAFLGTRPNISESHSEIRTRVLLCIGVCFARGQTDPLSLRCGEVRAVLRRNKKQRTARD